MYDHFLDTSISNTETCKAECRRKLRDNIIQECEIRISSEEGKLRFYKQIKKSFKLEPYLSTEIGGIPLHINWGHTPPHKLEPYTSTEIGAIPCHINNFALRKIITKFRGSDHTLKIEIGRHRKLEVADHIYEFARTTLKQNYIFCNLVLITHYLNA